MDYSLLLGVGSKVRNMKTETTIGIMNESDLQRKI